MQSGSLVEENEEVQENKVGTEEEKTTTKKVEKSTSKLKLEIVDNKEVEPTLKKQKKSFNESEKSKSKITINTNLSTTKKILFLSNTKGKFIFYCF